MIPGNVHIGTVETFGIRQRPDSRRHYSTIEVVSSYNQGDYEVERRATLQDHLRDRVSYRGKIGRRAARALLRRA